ncbi:MAG: ABC transporter permease subunit [Cellulomonadaceae bacterium]|jgi:arabinogalactan oligomer/maltooligosaccharide transport system permease protein|nr:ABC transporter permease subunit [Cellulomonadaceae bacterium]
MPTQVEKNQAIDELIADEKAAAEKAAATKRARTSHASDFGPGFMVKLVIMAAIDALGVYGLIATWTASAWGLFWPLLVLLLAANYVYFAKKHTMPMKYIFPGLAFLLVFQVSVVGYTVYVSFTNFGGANNVNKEQAITALLANSEHQVPNSNTYPVAVVEQGGDLGFAVVAQDGSLCAGAAAGDVCAGTADQPLAIIDGASANTSGEVQSMPDGWTILTMGDVLAQQNEVTALRVPLTDDADDGSLRTQDARTAFVAKPSLTYDASADTMTSSDGTVYSPNDNGQFADSDGNTLSIGWRVPVGFRNFTTAFGDQRYSGPFLKILAWTIAFAFLSVATTFLLGLFLAIVFNDTRLKGRKIYRTLLIFPYAIPGFLAALIWSGLLNTDFGFINTVLLGGHSIPWLADPWLARLSVIGVNLWLGFPYMFLICTGALQSLPGDVMEAAKVDGASPWRTWRSITMPLLLVSTAPLLISSFAFNFNNFTLIWMLTKGGPAFPGAQVPLGATDILISMVYQVSGLSGGGTTNFGLASALSIIVFVVVGTVSAIAFRQTRKLEEVM